MKLRLHQNSVRLRLTRSEVDQFQEAGLVEETVDFGGSPLVYMLHGADDCRTIQATFINGWITVTVPAADGQKWATGDEVGMKGTHSGLAILVEKDWQCVHPAGEEDEDAFPRP